MTLDHQFLEEVLAKLPAQTEPLFSGSLDGFVFKLEFTRDGKYLVAGSLEGDFKVFEINTSASCSHWKSHPEGALSLSVHPSRLEVVTSGQGPALECRNLLDGSLKQQFRSPSPWVAEAAWNRDGTVLATIASKSLVFWDKK